MKKVYAIFYILILIIIMGLGLFDIFDDYFEGADIPHLLTETLLISVTLELIRRILKNFKVQESQIRELQKIKTDLSQSLQKWMTDTESLRNLIRESILRQFQEWGLSDTETEVAFLTLRGFSFDQIAGLLEKSERTVRKQAGSVYEKSGFGGRAEFVGFFLESIFELDDEPSFMD